MKKNTALKWLLGRVGKQKYALIFACLFSMLQAAGVVWLALNVRNIINVATGFMTEPGDFFTAWIAKLLAFAGSKNSLLAASAAVVVINILFNAFARFFSSYVQGRITERININMRASFMKTIAAKDFARISSYHSGEIMNRIVTDIDSIGQTMVHLPINVFSMVSRLCLSFSALYIMDSMFSLMVAGGGILLFFLASLTKRPIKRLHTRMRESDGKVRAFMQEQLGSLLAIKAYLAYGPVERKTKLMQAEYFKHAMRKRTVSVISSTAVSSIMSIAYAFALIWGASKLFAGELAYGDLSAVLQLVNQVQTPLTGMSGLLPSYYAMLSSAERLIEIEELPNETGCDEKAYDGRELYEKLDYIEFCNVDFAYDEDEPVLKNASLRLEKGSFAAIVGASGSGKSTLMKLLLGIYPPAKGKVEFVLKDGERIPAGARTRRLFAYVPQNNLLLSGTVRECLTLFLGKTPTDARIWDALKAGCAYDFVSQLPDGLDSVLGENGQGLSEGQAQRLSVARAILFDAPILLLDEATSALDEATERRLLENIGKLRGKSCITITHRPLGVEMCSSIIRIADRNLTVEEHSRSV